MRFNFLLHFGARSTFVKPECNLLTIVSSTDLSPRCEWGLSFINWGYRGYTRGKNRSSRPDLFKAHACTFHHALFMLLSPQFIWVKRNQCICQGIKVKCALKSFRSPGIVTVPSLEKLDYDMMTGWQPFQVWLGSVHWLLQRVSKICTTRWNFKMSF